MKVLTIIAFLVLAIFTEPLFAQSPGTGMADSTFQVENQSELGGFIGSGRPAAFVGVDSIYSSTSSARRTSSSTARVTTTTRPRTATSSTQRLGSARTASALGNYNTQTIRSTTSLDVDGLAPSQQRPLPSIEQQLNRIPGIQEGQVAWTTSPVGTTAVLTGTASSERERRVAQQLLLLEPGINRVENLLQIR